MIKPISDEADERIARLEGAVENQARGLSELQRDFRLFIQEMRAAIKPNYVLWVSLAGVLATIIIALGAAAYVPVWITTNNINDKAQAAINWQKDYAYGRIPSSADAKISAIEREFTEIETQFRSADQTHNTQFAEQQRMNSVLMQMAQGKKPIEYPNGPYYFPNVTTDHHN